MGFTAAGISPTTVTTDKQAPLGFVLTVPDGDNGLQEWVYVQMTGSGTVKGRVVEHSATPFVVAAGAATTTRASCAGVAQHTIAQDSYGFVLRKGVGSVLADGSVTAGADITPDASAEVTDLAGSTNYHRVIGVALATDTGASTIVSAILDCGA
jgi:hypothetical protein